MCFEVIDFEAAEFTTGAELLDKLYTTRVIYFNKDDFEHQNRDFDFEIF